MQRIGIDFDNTIVCYDAVFLTAAKSRGLVAADWYGRKTELRDKLRQSPDGEKAWQALQGYVYGRGITEALPFPGVLEFLRYCNSRNFEIFIVSHKTRFGHFDADRVDLRNAALTWLDAVGISASESRLVEKSRIFFEDSMAEKIKRIRSLDVAVFIDDLHDVFDHADFPSNVSPILFGAAPAAGKYRAFQEWDAIQREIAP